MDLTRRSGHFIGYGSLAVAALSAIVCTTSTERPPLMCGAAVTSLSAFGAAYWLLTRLYLNDPEARREYQRQLQGLALSGMLSQFGSIESLTKILTPQSPAERDQLQQSGVSAFAGTHDPLDVITQKFYAEMGVGGAAELLSRTLSQLMRIYRSNHVRDMIGNRVVSSDAVRRLFLNDVEAAQTYTDLRNAFSGGESFSAVASGIGVNLMYRSDVEPLLAVEFPWAGLQRGARRAVVASLTTKPADVIAFVAEERKNLLGNFSFSAADLSAIIERCPGMSGADIMVCLDNGLASLVRDGITSLSWRDTRVGHSQVTEGALWELDSRHSIRALLHMATKPRTSTGDLHGADATELFYEIIGATAKGQRKVVAGPESVVSPKALRRLFGAAIPTTASFGAASGAGPRGGTPRTNLVAFLMYWEDVLLAYPEVVPPSVGAPMQEAYEAMKEAGSYTRLRQALGDYNAAVANKARTDQSKQRIRDLEGLLPSLKDAFADDCRRIHRTYAPRVAEALSKNSGLNINCAQQ